MDFIITIDTEADNQWIIEEKIQTENLRFIPRFQAICERYNFKPTYLCSYEIVQSPYFDETLRKYFEKGAAEIGAHLHPWHNPPFYPSASEEAKNHYFPTELPIEQFEEKLSLLTKLIASKIGRNPTSYRAGRFGFSADHIPILLKLGYKVDSSITPYTSWASQIGKIMGGPDFIKAPNKPYFLNETNVCISGDSNLLELPVTILIGSKILQKFSILRNFLLKHLQNRIIGIINRIFYLNPLWFRPFPQYSGQDLINIYKEAEKQGLNVVVFMFHSSELMENGSPYNKSPDEIEKLYQKLEKLFDFLHEQKVNCLTLSEYTMQK